MKNHPNTIVAAASSLGLGTIAVQVAAHFGVHLTAEEGLGIAGGLATIVLFIGRNGIVGTYQAVKQLVLHGTGKPSA